MQHSLLTEAIKRRSGFLKFSALTAELNLFMMTSHWGARKVKNFVTIAIVTKDERYLCSR